MTTSGEFDFFNLVCLSKQQPTGVWPGGSITHNPNHTLQFLLQVSPKTAGEKKKVTFLKLNSVPPSSPTIHRCPSVFWPYVEGVGCPNACWYWPDPCNHPFFVCATGWAASELLKCLSTNNKVWRLRYLNPPIVMVQCWYSEILDTSLFFPPKNHEK